MKTYVWVFRTAGKKKEQWRVQVRPLRWFRFRGRDYFVCATPSSRPLFKYTSCEYQTGGRVSRGDKVADLIAESKRDMKKYVTPAHYKRDIAKWLKKYGPANGPGEER
jgi:hypothetical protein